MKKYIKYLIIIVIILGIVLGLNYFIKPNMKKQFKDYLINKGFTVSDYGDLLIKQESNTKKTSFSLGDYTYMMEVNDSEQGTTASMNATYNYKNEEIIYSYRVNYNNSINVLFKGSYKNKNFTCDKEFSSATLSAKEINSICNLAKLNVEMFDLEAKTLLTYKYIDYIKNRLNNN